MAVLCAASGVPIRPASLLDSMCALRSGSGTCHALPGGVGNGDDKKTYIDVMEKVFGGVRISPDDEPRPDVSRNDPRSRPWLTGVTMSSVHVTLADDDDEDDEDRAR